MTARQTAVARTSPIVGEPTTVLSRPSQVLAREPVVASATDFAKAHNPMVLFDLLGYAEYPDELLYGYEPRDILKNTLTSVIQDQDPKMMTDAELEKLRADATR
ncbi:GL21955 [Drosophila persimilis]|uniref:GL21955 n=1 Tax=Drosophila persimilis TaxID=7234 RepID=B4GE53_DROPE|nr:GL21955 [Drosophila persimilis]